MKKALILLMSLFMATIILTGCGNSKSSKAESNPNVTVKKVNHKMPVLAGMEYTIKEIKTEKVLKNSGNDTNAELNLDKSDLNKKYYRYTIKYNLKNTNSKSVDLSLMQAQILDDSKTELSTSGYSDGFMLDDNNNGKIASETSTNGKFILISNNKLSLKHFSIKIPDAYTTEGGIENQGVISEGGISTY